MTKTALLPLLADWEFHSGQELANALFSVLEVIQFSQMTRKKLSFPCYGMQWGSSLYLYPLEEELVEYFSQPPKPALMNEVKMFGGRWIQDRDNQWRLVWSERAIKDFYLTNPIARASQVMQQCSAELLHSDELKEAAE